MAQIRTAQNRYEDAVTLLAQRYHEAPHAENLYALAEAQEKAGKHDAAQRSFAKFADESRAESAIADNSNRELIFYYVDYARQPEKGLDLARQELSRRHDVYTFDAYAWALAANGRLADAAAGIQKALATGLKDPKVLAHAQAIAHRMDDKPGL